jgi:Lar family restriction alleviation protein
MTNNPTIDGVSLLPCPYCGSKELSIRYHSPQANWIQCDDCESESRAFDSKAALLSHWNSRPAPPEVAALQSTIAQLQAESARIKARLCVCRDCGGQGEVYSGHSSYQGHNQPPEPDMDVCGTCDGDGVLGPIEDFEALASERDLLQARIAELESGMAEPVAYISETSLSFLSKRKEIANTSWRLNLSTKVSGDETQPLFATSFTLPFAGKIISKLRRCEECFSDFEADGVDIGRHWLDLLTQLGLLNRVQRSPALWEITQQGEDCLDATAALSEVRK